MRIDFNAKNKYNQTPLLMAIERGDIKSMEFLLDAGADIEGFDTAGVGVSYRPLGFATERSKKEAVQLLLDRGADVYGKDSLGYTSLQILISKPRYNEADLEIAKLLVKNGSNIYILTPDGKKLDELIPKSSKTELRAFLEECYAKDYEKNNTNFEQKAVQKSFASKEEDRRKESRSLGISRIK